MNIEQPTFVRYEPSRALLRARRFACALIRGFYALVPAIRNNVIVLNYHGIGANEHRFDVPEQNFREQISYLLQEKYVFISAAQLESWLVAKNIPNGRYVLLTFDDGDRSVLRVRDFLRTLKIRPAIFVLSQSAKLDPTKVSSVYAHLTENELRELHHEGWEIGSHSASHPHLHLVSSDDVMTAELTGSREALERTIGAPIRYFAYPHGAYDARVLERTALAGYAMAFTTDEKRLTPTTRMLALPRVGVNATHTLDEFKAIITPLAQFLKQIYGKLS